MKKIAISQSNYIPWKGYFDLIASVDEFIIYDDMQYTRRDWRNRNLIKTPHGIKWLTVPVETKGNYHQKIRDTKISDANWKIEHWKTLTLNYKRSPYFLEIATWLEPLYLGNDYQYISELNRSFIEHICEYLNINTTIRNSWDYNLIDGKTERLISLCEQSNSRKYFSGISAKNYIDQELFKKNKIKISWVDYTGYVNYPQLWGEFTHKVTILDLLFNCGKHSNRYMNYISE